MADYGFDSTSGFTYPSLSTIKSELLESYQTTYGSGFSDDDSNSMWRNALIIAEREYKVWQILALMYDYQTYSGAEDVYLDDLFNRVGIYRKDSSAASGYAVIETDTTIDTDDEITEDYTFSDSSGNSYLMSSSSTFGDLVCGLYITPDDFPDTSTSYTITITSVSDTTLTETVTGKLSSTFTDDVIIEFYQEIIDAFETVSDTTSDDTLNMYETDDGYVLAIGYDEDGNIEGLSDPVTMTIDTQVGLKASKFYVTCTESGYLSVVAGAITSITPTDSGYTTITNVDTFSTGSDVESDAAFRVRYQQEVGSAASGTKTSIIKAVLDVDDVTSCIIKDNPSNTDEDYAPAKSFNTIVQGGEDEDIAQAISDYKPINARTYGTSSYAVTQEDDNLETIYFTRATTQQVYLLIQYSTVSTVSLTSGEKTLIEDGIQDIVDEFTIGGTVFLANFSAAVFDALSTNRLSDLTISYRLDENDDWLTTNYIPDFNIIPTIDVDSGITYKYED